MKPITLSSAVRNYVSDCRKLRGLAESTVTRYEVSLTQFARPLLKEDRHLQLADVPHGAWQEWVLLADARANKTFNGRRAHLSAFLKWCYENDYLSPADKHLAAVRERPNTTTRVKSFVREQDLPAVIAAAGEWHARDAAFCEALWASWRRSGELAALRVRDVDLAPYPDSPNGRLSWENRKAHRPNQVLDMSPALQECLGRWLELYAVLARGQGLVEPGGELKASWYLFPALRVEGMSAKGKRRRLVLDPGKPIGQPDSVAREAFQRAGLWVPGMACHAFRRGAADALYDRAATRGHKNPLRLAMTALDHSSEAMTENYLNKDRDKRDLVEFLSGDGPAAPAPAAEAPPSVVADFAAHRARRARNSA
jgi:integrase